MPTDINITMDLAAAEPPKPLKQYYRTELSDDSIRMVGNVRHWSNYTALIFLVLLPMFILGPIIDDFQKRPTPETYLAVAFFCAILVALAWLSFRVVLYREEFLFDTNGFSFRCGYFSLAMKRTIPLHELKSFREYSYVIRRKRSSRTAFGIEAETIGLPFRFSQDGYRDEINWLLFHLNVLLAKLNPKVFLDDEPFDFSVAPSDSRFEFDADFDTLRFTQRNLFSGRQWSFSPNEIVRKRFFTVFSLSKRYSTEKLHEIRIFVRPTVSPDAYTTWTQTVVSTEISRTLQFIDVDGKIICSIDRLTEGEAHWIAHVLKENRIFQTGPRTCRDSAERASV